jgi:hypothetical protein
MGRVRWVIVCLLVCVGTADAKRLVILEPPMVRKCPKAKTFPLIQACLKKHGTTVVVKRSLGNARLVATGTTSNGRQQDTALYLYVERNGQWHIAGTFESWMGYSVLGFEYQKLGKHTGYRIDIGQAIPTNVMLDDVNHAPAVLRTHKSLYCSGANYDCVEAVRSCEVYVAGQPRFVFRGTLELDLQSVNIKGDRSRGGAMCSPPPKIYLGWPTQP